MVDDARCARCGERFPPGETKCLYCAGTRKYPLLHRDAILLAIVLALAAALWAATHYFTLAYQQRELRLARQWYDRGDADMRAARFEQAIADLRTALVYAHESAPVRLRLAEALADAKRLRQAQAYLEALWDEQPGNAFINLELARLAAATGEAPDVLRYYHGAIYGVWDEDPIDNRRRARLELIKFLLGRGQRQQAESELIALGADLPSDPRLLADVGGYFLQTGDARRALDEFETAVRLDPHNQAALRGAAEAAFRERQYAEAKRYGAAAVALAPDDAAAANVQRITELVLEMDPELPRLSLAERMRRVAGAVQQAQSRLQACVSQKNISLSSRLDQQTESALSSDYAQLLSLQPRLRTAIVRREPDLLDTAMDAVLRSELDAQQTCGGAAGADAALLLLAKPQGRER